MSTGSNLREQKHLGKDRQLALYQVGVQKLWPDAKEVRLIWYLVAFDVEMKSMRTPEALDALRDAAISFAEKEGVQVIAGTEARLRVTGKDRVVSPAKGSEEREALEKALRTAGVWDEVAALDPFALEKAVAEGKWAGDVLERIKAYVSIE
jgi:hypothetical protein